jgi:hypothetical protein
LRLGGERRGEDHHTRACQEGAPVYHWVLSQALCESGARGFGAWRIRAGFMQGPSSQAGRECSRVGQQAREPGLAFARHPYAPVLDARIERAAAPVLLEEG